MIHLLGLPTTRIVSILLSTDMADSRSSAVSISHVDDKVHETCNNCPKVSPEVSESIPSFLYLSASINKVDFMFLVDTGATHSCIPLNLVEIKNLPINDKKIQQLKLANGDYLESPGTVDAQLVLNNGPPTLSATDKNEFLLDSVIIHANHP
ncbi:hypothetical protein RCL1_008709 [Eukaryota sp. TZLM3-RCL]